MGEIYPELLERQLAELPYFRAFLRAVEARYYQNFTIEGPVLDLGAGDGHFAARTFPQSFEIGLDPSFSSLREAQKYAFYGLVINGDGHRLPFPSESFQTIISNSVLEHIRDVDAVLRELERVLANGGRLIACMPNSNFTQNLSIARLLEKISLPILAKSYRRLFNKISRHYHPDKAEHWRQRLETAGFKVVKQWNYFPPQSLRILEWGHFLGLPNWLNKKVFGRWVLRTNSWYVRKLFHWLYPYYAQKQEAEDGAYTFFVAEKKI